MRKDFLNDVEALLFKKTTGFCSRVRIWLYVCLGLSAGKKNRFERGRVRRLTNIQIGSCNAFTQGYMLWPIDESCDKPRIVIGDYNYFNRNVMIDACGLIEIGSKNMFGPDVYITDSNHSYGDGISPQEALMQRGKVKIGHHCWIGAKAVILKDVELGDHCVVAAGAVVNKSFPSGSVIGGVPAKLLKQKL